MKSLKNVMEAFIIGSLPVRGAWIEIVHTLFEFRHFLVAPRKGSVD